MLSQTLIKKITKLPNSPGVYFFFSPRKKILYIGKATSLRNRVRSYFLAALAETRGPLIEKMIAEARGIEIRKTGSVLEALLLEADLIKKFKPPFNTEGKDDKSYNCVAITDEDFPRVLVIRQKDLDPKRLKIENYKTCPEYIKGLKITYGPFPNGNELREALKIIRKIFPWRDNKCNPDQGRPCFNRQIGLCPGVCTGEIGKIEYVQTIQRLRKFFVGNIAGLERELKLEMAKYATLQEFEKADETKRKLFAIRHIQDISLLRREVRSDTPLLEAYDIAHTVGKETVGVMVSFSGGLPQKSGYRMFKIKEASHGDDVASIREVLSRRLRHPEWTLPDLIAVDGGVAQKQAAESIISEAKLSIPVVAVVKDNKHRPKGILGSRAFVHKNESLILFANAEAHRFALTFHRRRMRFGLL